MSFKTPRARVSGLGSAGTGTEHWWSMRISSVALIPLTVLFVLSFAPALGESRETVLELYRNPFRALTAILFLAVCFHHLKEGLQVVIEDYVHAKGLRTVLLMGNTFLCALAGLGGIFAVLLIALGGN